MTTTTERDKARAELADERDWLAAELAKRAGGTPGAWANLARGHRIVRESVEDAR